ncbi:Uncharacterised protein [Ewingella americana]|uniref:Uncharacterized protein n=1 Tax=Ewingella americana TaxID=41202 RepID=A0A377NEF2_9GAMM|nr:Uncharacterised protein [Ewingella americana]
MDVFLAYLIENPSRVLVSLASIGLVIFAALLRGAQAVFASLLAIFWLLFGDVALDFAFEG